MDVEVCKIGNGMADCLQYFPDADSTHIKRKHILGKINITGSAPKFYVSLLKYHNYMILKITKPVNKAVL